MTVIKGKITDAKTGEPIYNAHVIFTDKTGKPYSPLVGTVTDFDGNYSFDSLGGYYLQAVMLGYAGKIKPIDLTAFSSGGGYSNTLNFQLQPTAYNLPEVVISAKRPKQPGWWENNKGTLLTMAGIGVISYFVLRNN